MPLSELAGEAVVTPGSGDGARGLSPEIAALFAVADVQVGAGRRVASPHTLVSMVRSRDDTMPEVAVRIRVLDP